MNINVEIARDNKKWAEHKRINRKTIAAIASEVLSRYENLSKIQEIELSILLTDDESMKKLNKEFRNKDKVTNVLSFPDTVIDWKHIQEFKPNEDYMYLGDVAFGYEITLQEAGDKGWEFTGYFTHLLVHSLLHLIGYDHEEQEEAEVMEKLETDILRKLGITSPY
jgi:probable rRNA maturation factor